MHRASPPSAESGAGHVDALSARRDTRRRRSHHGPRPETRNLQRPVERGVGSHAEDPGARRAAHRTVTRRAVSSARTTARRSPEPSRPPVHGRARSAQHSRGRDHPPARLPAQEGGALLAREARAPRSRRRAPPPLPRRRRGRRPRSGAGRSRSRPAAERRIHGARLAAESSWHASSHSASSAEAAGNSALRTSTPGAGQPPRRLEDRPPPRLRRQGLAGAGPGLYTSGSSRSEQVLARAFGGDLLHELLDLPRGRRLRMVVDEQLRRARAHAPDLGDAPVREDPALPRVRIGRRIPSSPGRR